MLSAEQVDFNSEASLTFDEDKNSEATFPHTISLDNFMQSYPGLIQEIVKKVVIKNLKLVDIAAEDIFIKTAKVSSKITIDISKKTTNLKSLIQTFSKVYLDRKRNEIEVRLKYLNGLSVDIYKSIPALHVNNVKDYETIIQAITQCFIDKFADFVHPNITKIDPGRLAMLVSPPDEKFQAQVKEEQKGKSTWRQTLLDAEWTLDTSIVPELKEIKSPAAKATEECSLSSEEIFKGAFLSQVNEELCESAFIRNSHLESRFAEATTTKKRAYDAGWKAGQAYKQKIGDDFVEGEKHKIAAHDAYLKYKKDEADLKRSGLKPTKSFGAHQRAITPTPLMTRENKGERKTVSSTGFLSPKPAASSTSGSVPKESSSDDFSLLPGVVPKSPKSKL